MKKIILIIIFVIIGLYNVQSQTPKVINCNFSETPITSTRYNPILDIWESVVIDSIFFNISIDYKYFAKIDTMNISFGSDSLLSDIISIIGTYKDSGYTYDWNTRSSDIIYSDNGTHFFFKIKLSKSEYYSKTNVITVCFTDQLLNKSNNIYYYVFGQCSIKGYVYDQNGVPLANIPVDFILHEHNNTYWNEYTTYTDYSGYYSYWHLLGYKDSLIIKANFDSKLNSELITTYYDSAITIGMAKKTGKLNWNQVEQKDIHCLPFNKKSGTKHIYGKILDSTMSKSINNIDLILVNKNKQPVAKTTTNENGYFIFSDLSNDLYSLVVDDFNFINITPYKIDTTNEDTDTLRFLLFNNHLEKIVLTDIRNYELSDLIIFPSITTSTINIQFMKSNEVYNIEILNSTGQKVFSKQNTLSTHTTQQINITEFEQGLYFVRLNMKNRTLVKKIIKQ